MSTHPTIIERAYELARTGEYPDSNASIKRLKTEGYDAVERHFAGSSLRRAIRDICRAAAPAETAGPATDSVAAS